MIIGLLGPAGSGKDTAGEEMARTLKGTCISFAGPMKEWCERALAMPQVWGSLKLKETPLSSIARRRAEKTILKISENSLRPTYGVPTPLMDLLDVVTGRRGPMLYGTGRANAERAIWQWWIKLKAEKSLTPRRVLQTFGTEFGRAHLSEKFWVDRGLARAWAVLNNEAAAPGEAPKSVIYGSAAVIITDVRFRNEVVALKRVGARVVRIVRTQPQKSRSSAHASETEQNSIPVWWCNHTIWNNGTIDEFRRDVRDYADDIMKHRAY